MSPTQNFPSMGGKRLRHYPHKISPPWEEYNVILCNYIYNHSRGNKCPPPNEALFLEGQSETTPSIRVCNLLAGFLVMDSGGPQLGQVYS